MLARSQRHQCAAQGYRSLLSSLQHLCVPVLDCAQAHILLRLVKEAWHNTWPQATNQWKFAADDRQQLKRLQEANNPTLPQSKPYHFLYMSTNCHDGCASFFNYPILAASVLTVHPEPTHGPRCLKDLHMFDEPLLCMTHAGPCFLLRP
jgi:hypothetical protein